MTALARGSSRAAADRLPGRGEESGDRLGAALMRALKARHRPDRVCRRRRRRHGGARVCEPVSDRATSRSSASALIPRVCRPSAANPRHGRQRSSQRGRMCSSSSTARISPIGSRGACARGRRRSRSSTTSRRRSGPGGPGARAHAPPMSTTCWRCCRSSRRCIAARRAAVHLCRPSADRAVRRAASERRARRARRLADPPVLLVLPGSRSGEIRRMAAVFGEAVALRRRPRRRVRSRGADRAASAGRASGRRPRTGRCGRGIVVDAAEKCAAFRVARAALAKSGTVTLELALAGVPMVAAYKVSLLDEIIARVAMRRAVRHPRQSGARRERRAGIPAARDCTPDQLAAALAPLACGHAGAAAPGRGVRPARRDHGGRRAPCRAHGQPSITLSYAARPRG